MLQSWGKIIYFFHILKKSKLCKVKLEVFDLWEKINEEKESK